MTCYPKPIIAAYASGEITSERFISALSTWQKARGMDYKCRGTGGRGYVGVTYRGRNAVIRGGAVTWISGEWRDACGYRRYTRGIARSVREFMRRADIEICARLRGLE